METFVKSIQTWKHDQVLDLEPRVDAHYRGHKLAVWNNLVIKLDIIVINGNIIPTSPILIRTNMVTTTTITTTTIRCQDCWRAASLLSTLPTLLLFPASPPQVHQSGGERWIQCLYWEVTEDIAKEDDKLSLILKMSTMIMSSLFSARGTSHSHPAPTCSTPPRASPLTTSPSLLSPLVWSASPSVSSSAPS